MVLLIISNVLNLKASIFLSFFLNVWISQLYTITEKKHYFNYSDFYWELCQINLLFVSPAYCPFLSILENKKTKQSVTSLLFHQQWILLACCEMMLTSFIMWTHSFHCSRMEMLVTICCPLMWCCRHINLQLITWGRKKTGRKCFFHTQEIFEEGENEVQMN